MLAFRAFRPAGRRLLPLLLPPVDGQVEQWVAVAHHFDAATRRPIGLEDLGALAQVADDMHSADPPSHQERLQRTPGRRVPGLAPAHELAVPGALFIGALAD